MVIWNKVFKNGPRHFHRWIGLCAHTKKKLWKTALKKGLSTKNVTWFILEYFVPYIGRIAKRLSVVLTKNKFSTKFSSFE